MTRILGRWAILLAATLLVPACGGGGGNGGGGAGTVPLGDTSVYLAQGIFGYPYSIVQAVDGSGDLFIGGDFAGFDKTSSSGIARLSTDGTLVDTFRVGTGFNGIVRAVAPLNDGSGDVVVGGTFTTFDGASVGHIARVNPDGSLETTFSTGTGFNGNVYSLAVAVDGSGDIYVGGSFSLFNGSSAGSIARLNGNGSYDSGFITGTGFGWNSVNTLRAADDGSGDVLAGGMFGSYNGTTSGRIVRLNSDGSVDGTLAVGSGFTGSQVNSIVFALDGSGDVYVGGSFTAYKGTTVGQIARLDSNGTLDAGFATGSGFDFEVKSIDAALDGSGDLYVAGWFTTYNGTSHGRLVRLDSSGTADAAFVTGAGLGDAAFAVYASPATGGDVVVAGMFFTYDGSRVHRMVRLDPNGSIDSRWTLRSGFTSGVDAVCSTADGSHRVYVGGSFTSYNREAWNRIVRLNPGGGTDSTFSIGSGFGGKVRCIALAEDGSGDLYVGGEFFSYNAASSSRIIRLNPDGTVDSSMIVGTGFNGTVYQILPIPGGGGDVYVCGDFTTYKGATTNRIIRLNADGSVDSSFDPGAGMNAAVYSLALSNDGSGDLYVGGNFSSYQGISIGGLARLNANGSLDAGFNTGTGLGTPASSGPYALCLAPDGSGDLYVGGSFMSYNGVSASNLLRLNADGSMDAGFISGGGAFGSVMAILSCADGSGDVLVGGLFSQYNGSSHNGLVRLQASGSVDPAFEIGPGLDNQVSSMAASPDGFGDFVLGGGFRTYAGYAADGLVEINGDGSLD